MWKETESGIGVAARVCCRKGGKTVTKSGNEEIQKMEERRTEKQQEQEPFPELPMQWRNYGYEIVEMLGKGAYGAVYKLVKHRDTGEETVSALKVIEWRLTKQLVQSSQYGGDWERARRSMTRQFSRAENEVSILESFTGAEHIVQIKGSCLEKMPEENFWKLYIQMEYLQPLMDYVETHPLDEPEVIRLGIELCTALEQCHAAGVIHRDIKPDNIMVSENGSFQLGDFGVAREMVRGSMTVVGTYGYVAPEVTSADYDKTADIYSLGMVLYYFLNDRKLPFSDIEDPAERARYRISRKGVLPEPRKAFAQMRKIIGKACAYSPQDRYASAAEFRQALKEAQQYPYGFCPECGRRLVKKKGPYGEFVACSGFRKGDPSSCGYRRGLEKLLDELNRNDSAALEKQ